MREGESKRQRGQGGDGGTVCRDQRRIRSFTASPGGAVEGSELQKAIFTMVLKHQALAPQGSTGASPCPQPWKTLGPT